jgi:hypothetical protein
MLRKPYYAGLIRDPHSGELLEAEHVAIVDRDVWERVQRTHGKESTTNAKAGRRAAGALSGLLRCAGCGYSLHFQKHGGGTSRQPVYRCGARTSSTRCPAPAFVNAARLEQYVLSRFFSTVMAAMYLDRVTMHSNGSSNSAWRAELDDLRARAKRDTAAIDKLVDRHLVHGTLTEADFDRQLRRLEERRDQALARADRLDAEHAPENAPDYATLNGREAVTVEEKRAAFRELIARIDVSPARTRGGADPSAKIGERIAITWVPAVDERIVALAAELHPMHWSDGHTSMRVASGWKRELRRLAVEYGFALPRAA